MHRSIVGRAAIFAAALVLVASSVAFAAVSTDRYYYNLGDVVQICGDGMDAGESVTVDVAYPDMSLAQAHVVVADTSGAFADSYAPNLSRYICT